MVGYRELGEVKVSVAKTRRNRRPGFGCHRQSCERDSIALQGGHLPELPEVENIRRYLIANQIVGTQIERVEIPWPNAIRHPSSDVEELADLICRRSILDVNRRGKYLILPLEVTDSNSNLVLHMGMTGSLHFRRNTESSVHYARATFFLNDDRRIELNDPRKWAKLWAVSDPSMAFPRLAPDPWEVHPKTFADHLRSRKSRIKPTLLDQSLVAGVGNIYADESLHRVGISPMRRCHQISESRLIALHAAVLDSLEHAIEFIATNPTEDGSPYVVDAYDDRMRLQRSPDAKCPTCDTPITSRRIGGRTAYYCRRCQSIKPSLKLEAIESSRYQLSSPWRGGRAV